MQVLGQKIDATDLVVLAGELDRADGASLMELLQMKKAGKDTIVLPGLSDLTSADSVILMLIYDLVRDRPDGNRLGFAAPCPGIKRMLALGGLTTHPSVRVFASMEEARLTLPPDGTGRYHHTGEE